MEVGASREFGVHVVVRELVERVVSAEVPGGPRDLVLRPPGGVEEGEGGGGGGVRVEDRLQGGVRVVASHVERSLVATALAHATVRRLRLLS